MGVMDVWQTARLLVAQHGAQALLVAESQAVEDLLCGDALASADWEQVSDAIEALLDHDLCTFTPTATIH